MMQAFQYTMKTIEKREESVARTKYAIFIMPSESAEILPYGLFSRWLNFGNCVFSPLLFLEKKSAL